MRARYALVCLSLALTASWAAAADGPADKPAAPAREPAKEPAREPAREPAKEPARAAAAPDAGPWRALPVQHGGRHKTLDTLARESLRALGNRSSITDPETGQVLDPASFYLALLFDWQGWTHEQRGRLLFADEPRQAYHRLHTPDRWDQALLLRVDDLDLRARLGLAPEQTHVSPAFLATALIDNPATGRPQAFLAWADKQANASAAGVRLGPLETQGLQLADKLWTYQGHRMGLSLELLPIPNSSTGDWSPLAHLALIPLAAGHDPDGRQRRVQELFRDALQAHRAGDAAAFHAAGAELTATLRDLAADAGGYPTPTRVRVELAYNAWAPFRIAWALMLTAAVMLLLHLGSGWRLFYPLAFVAFGAGLAATVAGFACRVYLTGRAPVTNMYESVVYVGLGVAVLGLVLELVYRARTILLAAAGVSTLALVLADTTPSILDPTLRPLEPVLRQNFWLVVHVMTITLSYAAFALALGIANIALGYFLVRSSNQNAIASLCRFTYRCLQVGVLLLAAGTILGGVWADYSWGRFWGWDPKEVWALVALLGYLSVLHARYAGWVGQRGLAFLSVACFSLVVMAWYGVNFVLGAGLHSYGFGGGGAGWVASALVLQLAFAGVAVGRSRSPIPAPTPPEPLVIAHRAETAPAESAEPELAAAAPTP